MFATLCAFPDKGMGVGRDALPALDALVILVLSVLSDPLMGTASSAVADKGMGSGRDSLATLDAFVLCIWHGRDISKKGKRGQEDILTGAPAPAREPPPPQMALPTPKPVTAPPPAPNGTLDGPKGSANREFATADLGVDTRPPWIPTMPADANHQPPGPLPTHLDGHHRPQGHRRPRWHHKRNIFKLAVLTGAGRMHRGPHSSNG